MSQSETAIIKLNRLKLSLLVFFGVIILAMGYWMFSLGDEDIGAGGKLTNPFIFHSLGFACMLLGIFFIYALGGKLIDWRPGLQISCEGITENSHFRSVGFIPWLDIAKFQTCPVGDNLLIYVIVKNPMSYINKAPLLQRLLLRAMGRAVLSPICISPSALKIDIESLLSRLNESLGKYQKSVNYPIASP